MNSHFNFQSCPFYATSRFSASKSAWPTKLGYKAFSLHLHFFTDRLFLWPPRKQAAANSLCIGCMNSHFIWQSRPKFQPNQQVWETNQTLLQIIFCSASLRYRKGILVAIKTWSWHSEPLDRLCEPSFYFVKLTQIMSLHATTEMHFLSAYPRAVAREI